MTGKNYKTKKGELTITLSHKTSQFQIPNKLNKKLKIPGLVLFPDFTDRITEIKKISLNTKRTNNKYYD